MYTIEEVLKNDIHGLCYQNRLILPFAAHFLKIIVNKDIITDFSLNSKGVFIREIEDFTDLYFLEYKDLNDSISKYEAIKMVIVEKGKDIFDFDNHIKLSLYLEKKHKVKIEECDHDIIFLE
ncbi:MAG: hypothetical protein JSW63_06175 [Ignavibacterium sp.]|nr:MAG: hypothetical protein JSW63_06175 [Ignavibacterium sp.]